MFSAELLDGLDRYLRGQDKALRVVGVPSLEGEEKRALIRYHRQVMADRSRFEGRGKGLLCAQGIEVRGSWWGAKGWRELTTDPRLKDWMKEQLEGWRKKLLSAEAEQSELRRRIEAPTVQTPAPTVQTPVAAVQTPVPVASAQKVSSLPSPLKGYPGDRPRKDGIGIATEVLLGQTPVASKLNDLKSALEAIARKDKKALSVLIDQGKVAIWPEHTYCFDAWTDLSDQLKLFRRVYTEDASEVVWIPAPVVEDPALVSDSNVPKADRVDGGDSEEPRVIQKAKKQSTSATSFNPFGRNLLDPRCAAALVDCEGQGLAYYSKVQNVVSEDDPAEQARLYLNSEEAVLVKKYGAKGADVYEDGFYRTVNDIFENDLGPQPRADWLDGGIKEIGDPIIASMNDPRSYKFDRFTTEVTQYEKTWCWKVDYYFRGKNAFGALILNHVFAYFRKGGLIAIKEAND